MAAGSQAASANCGTTCGTSSTLFFLSLRRDPPTPFGALQHVKILQFNIVLGLCGLAVLFRAAAMPDIGGRAGLSLSDATGDVLAIVATVALGIFSLM
jgi:hypothetical protein